MTGHVATREYFARLGISLPERVELDDAPHRFYSSGKEYEYEAMTYQNGTPYLGVELVGGVPIMDYWRYPEFDSEQSRKEWIEARKRAAADPTVRREIARYRALSQIGWIKDLCDGCKRKAWSNLAWAENLFAPGPGNKPAHFSDIAAAVSAEVRALSEITGRQTLNDADRERQILALRRIAAAARMFDDGKH